MKRLRIICCGRLAQEPIGQVDNVMAYVLGLQRLGHEVYVLEEVHRRQSVDATGQRVPLAQWPGRLRFESLARAYGVWPRSALLLKSSHQTHGMSYPELLQVARSCDLLLVRSGFLKRSDILDPIACRVYVDGNPGVPQVLLAQHDDHYGLAAYTHLFTIGMNLGTPACPLPLGGREWRKTLFPVVLEQWPVAETNNRERFTTISSWGTRRGFAWQGRAAGEKDDSWLKFISLPRRTSQPLELALKIDPRSQAAAVRQFRENGWHLTDPARLCSFQHYRGYLAGSRAEYSIAHPRCVEFNIGWVSDRSIRYLASGRPALVQSTGIESHLPTGRGLLTFRTMEEAVAGIDQINGDYAAHCQAARSLAEEWFDSDRILRDLLREVGY